MQIQAAGLQDRLQDVPFQLLDHENDDQDDQYRDRPRYEGSDDRDEPTDEGQHREREGERHTEDAGSCGPGDDEDVPAQSSDTCHPSRVRGPAK